MGAFDDLIPSEAETPAPPPLPSMAASSNPFADLIPKKAGEEAMAAPATAAPVAGNPFSDLIPATAAPGGEEPAGVLSTFGSAAAKAAIGLPGEVLKGVGVGLGSLDSSQPIEQGALYRTGVQLSHYADTWGPSEASVAANPIANVAGSTVGGFAGAAPALAASVLGAPATATGALAAGTIAAFAAAGAGSTFNEALLKGADENTAAKAAGLNAIVAGGLGALPLGAMLSPIRAYAPELTGWAATTLEKALVSGVVFTSIGEGQEFLGRQIAKNFYDPEAGYSPDVSRLLGSLIGGGIIGTVTPRMLYHEQNNPVTDAALQAAAAGVTHGLPESRESQRVKKMVDMSSQMPAPVVAAADAAQATGEPPPKIRPATEAATGIASAPAPERGWLAYHGTAADFERFDPAFIGTGEGNATYGVGAVYVGENKTTGTTYQNQRGSYKYEGQPYDGTNPLHLASLLLKQEEGDRNRAIQRADVEGAKGTIGPAYKESSDLYNATSKILASDAPIAPLERIGNLYSVLVTRPKDHFADWDLLLPQQSDHVRKALENSKNTYIQEAIKAKPDSSYNDIYAKVARFLRAEGVEDYASRVQASKIMEDAGIAGHRYLDAGSRVAGDRVAMLEGFIKDNERLMATTMETQKLEKPGHPFHARMQELIDGYLNKIVGFREEITAAQNLTYNAVVFKADDVKITHRNGDPVKAEVQRAIDDINKGSAVEDKGDGVAIVNGREVGQVTADELKQQFGGAANDNVIDLAAERAKRDNGYSINERAMQAAGVKDFPDTPITPATEGPRETNKQVFGGKVPPEAQVAAAAADHYSRRMRWLIGLRELLNANPHLKGLQDYGINLDHMLRYAAERLVGAEDTVRLATALNKEQKAAVYKLFDDYGNMRYLTPEERTKQIIRRPTDIEFKKMVADTGVNQKGLTVFSRMTKDYEQFIRDMITTMREKTVNLSPKAMQKENERLDALEKQLEQRPFVPFTRFGKFTVLIQGPTGNRFYRTETQHEQNKLHASLSKTLKQGETISKGKLPESSIPFSGLPVQMLDIVQKQFLNSAQKPGELRAALELLKYESDPVRSLSARFSAKAITPGYSQDFFRGYANFMFHGSRQLSRMRYVDLLKQSLVDLRASAQGAPDAVKRNEISDYVERHYKNLLDPTTDWSIPRAFLFHMVLGFRAASAATNLMQTLISTYPHLASEFGDFATVRATTKAAANWQNFYSRLKTMEETGPEFRAMQELMRLGVIKGAFAPMLAGLSENRNLLSGYGGVVGEKLQTVLTHYLKMSGGLFELSEQANRRIAGMATYDLALHNPNAKFVLDAVARDMGLRGELVAKGLPINEANAIVAAKVMIDRTQGQYTREYRPAYMSGKVGSSVFTFKLFTHQMVGNMWNYPAAGWRMILVMGALGGLAGIPGYQDLNGVLKFAASWLFGKDFDLDKEVRSFAVHTLGMKGEGVFNDPFTITKGFASRGYGIPAMLDTIGEWAGVGKLPIPETDRSAAVGLGNILPADFGRLTKSAVQANPGDTFADAISRGAGAGGSYAYNVYKAMANIKDDPDGFKRWERVGPTFLANMSQAARTYREGALKSQSGASVVRFDPHDTEHMMEILSMALGYTPFRVMREWTRIRAEKEATTYWEMRQKVLLNQFWSAVDQNDADDKDRVLGAIRNFNEEIRGTDARAFVLTGDTLKKSIQAHAMTKAKQEAGIPLKKAAIPLVRSVRELFPGAQVDTRPE